MERNVDAAQRVAYYPSASEEAHAAAPPPRGRNEQRDASIARSASRRRRAAAKARTNPPVVLGDPVRQLERNVSDAARRRNAEHRRARVTLTNFPDTLIYLGISNFHP